MNFLVDNQLPGALARFLVEPGHSAKHVLELSLDETPDVELWQRAIASELIVISKDEDFFHLANRPDDIGRLVWVRIGNGRKQALLVAFKAALPGILAAFAEGYRIVEVR